MTALLISVIIVALALLASSIRLVQQYEQGVVLRFGRLLPEIRGPGLRLIVPITDRMRKVSLQTVVDVAAEKNSTLVMPFPVELLRFFDRVTATDTRATSATETPAEVPNGP